MSGDRRSDWGSVWYAVEEQWAASLPGGAVDPDVDFFVAGGDSLTAMWFVQRVRRATGVRLSLADLLRAGTMRAVAEVVTARVVQRAENGS